MPQLKAEHVNAFLDATKDALAIMAGIQIRRSRISVKHPGDANTDVSGIIGLAGDVAGSVVLNFPFKSIPPIVSKFIGAPVANPRDYEALDAIGELANLVAGGAKRKLAETGLRFQIGLPTLVIGPSHTVSRPDGVPTVCIHWTCDEGDFVLEVGLKIDPDDDGRSG